MNMVKQLVGWSTQVICCIGRLSLSLEIIHGHKYHFFNFFFFYDDYVVGPSGNVSGQGQAIVNQKVEN